MEQIFRVVLSLSVSGSLIGLLLLLFRPIAGKFFAKRWTYYLWLLVLVRLLTPIHGNVNLMDNLSNTLTMAGTELADADNGKELAAGSESAQMQSEMLQKKESVTDEAALLNMADSERAADEAFRVARIFFFTGVVWIFGVFFTFLKKSFVYRRFVKGVRAACEPVTDERVLNKAMEIQTRLGIGKTVPLYKSSAVDIPMLIGFWRPCIYLPSALLAQMSGREYDVCLILHHELIHYKRRDIWYKWLFQAALCVHWFNPLLYVFSRKFNVDCEFACDEAVMGILSDEGRRAYGNVLLDVAQKNLCESGLSGKNLVAHKNIPTMTLLEEKHTLKERLQEIAHYHKSGMVIGVCSAAAFLLFATVAVVCGVAGAKGNVIVLKNTGSLSAQEGTKPGNTSSLPAQEETKLGNFAARVWGQISDPSYSLDEPLNSNEKGTPYRMYDDDALIAGESESDVWRAYDYCGGENSATIQKFALNGSDTLWILYANKETDLEITSEFDLRDGRFKLVWVRPDQTVQTLNESGENHTEKITLPEGRNVIKMVGQKAKVEHIDISYSGIKKEDFDGIYGDEDLEYAYQVLEGKKPIDVSKLHDEVCLYLKEEEVSELYKKAWEEEVVISEQNWEDLWLYSDVGLTSKYLLEELQAGKIREFSSSVLCGMAPYMEKGIVSECFRCLLERGGVFESDWGEIFQYSDSRKSAKYLAEALRRGEGEGFSDRNLEQISHQVSTGSLVDIVTAMDRDQLSFDGLLQYVIPFVQKQDEAVTCICYYIDLGNALTDTQLRALEGFLSEEDFYRIVEYNGKKK